MTITIKQNHVLIGLIILTFLAGWITVSAMSNDDTKSYSHTTEQKHYSEANCNVDDHYVNGVHTHDIDNCTIVEHNHNGTTQNTNTQIVKEVHHSEASCNVNSHYTNGVHYHDEATCTVSGHNHNTTNNNTQTNTNTQTVKEVHHSEANCNVNSHYTNGVHYHDEAICTVSGHNHNTTNNNTHHNNNKHNGGHH